MSEETNIKGHHQEGERHYRNEAPFKPHRRECDDPYLNFERIRTMRRDEYVPTYHEAAAAKKRAMVS